MGLQKYKIYVNGTPVFLATPSQRPEIAIPVDKNNLTAHYTGKKKLIRQYLDLINKDKSLQSIIIVAADLDSLWADFQSCFKILEAAGGYVQNQENQLLVFYRRGSWDMPKGKIDAGETPEEAAVREVQEETGLVNLGLNEFLLHTWHTYEHKDRQILKKTWWYRMHTADTQLIPQTEEDIEEIRWVNPQTWIEQEKEVYDSIRDVIREGLKK